MSHRARRGAEKASDGWAVVIFCFLLFFVFVVVPVVDDDAMMSE